MKKILFVVFITGIVFLSQIAEARKVVEYRDTKGNTLYIAIVDEAELATDKGVQSAIAEMTATKANIQAEIDKYQLLLDEMQNITDVVTK